ncbi:MAG: sugar transferase [Candidatus Theseobacter exili]|nr:sugar transferase [Candidatus Theseobacter exili]
MNKRKLNNYSAGGYLKEFYLFDTFLTILLSIVLLIFTTPIFIFLSIFILISSGPPVFYKGIRLGLHKKPFVIYKFRTMVPNAEKTIGAQIITDKEHHDLTITMGKFLRDTRLDELPQLLNLLKGDMEFVGPRPQRPEVYRKICRKIRNYDKRFTVKPGLIGYTQLFLPHSAPKRIQSIINNKFSYKKQKILFNFCIVIYTGITVLKAGGKKIAMILSDSFSMKKASGFNYHNKRTLERVKANNMDVHINYRNDTQIKADLLNINEEAMLIHSPSKLPDNELLNLDLHNTMISTKNPNYSKCKSAYCTGTVYKQSDISDNGYNYRCVIKYKPKSQLNFYMIMQYFLNESMIKPSVKGPKYD